MTEYIYEIRAKDIKSQQIIAGYFACKKEEICDAISKCVPEFLNKVDIDPSTLKVSFVREKLPA